MVLIAVIGIWTWSKKYFETVAIVIPHHNYVKEIREKYLAKIKKQRPEIKRIIIVGPDHFSVRQNEMMYANADWDLSNGELSFDREAESWLGSSLILENNWVKNDHTIYNLMPEIKVLWPESKVFPIILGQKIPLKKLNGLVEKISKVCDKDCLLVASVDFSHYLPAAMAEIHDIKSIKALENMETEEAEKLEVDSQQTLYILMRFAKLRGAEKWNLFSYTNSGVMENNRDAETTSHVMGEYSKGIKIRSDVKSDRPYTFMVVKNTNFERDKKTLGERFFYGVDGYNADKLPFEVPENMAVMGVKNGKRVELVFEPLEMKDGAMYLLRGERKTEELKKFGGGRMNYEE